MCCIPGGGVQGLSPGWGHCVMFLARHFVLTVTLESYTKEYISTIDQVRGQDGWIVAKLFLGVFMGQEKVKVHKKKENKKKKRNKVNIDIQPS